MLVLNVTSNGLPRPAELRSPAEIDVEIFDLGRPVVDEGVFDTGAAGPAGLRLAEAADAGDAALDLAESGAGGEIGQEAVEGIADPAARGAEPVFEVSQR